LSASLLDEKDYKSPPRFLWRRKSALPRRAVLLEPHRTLSPWLRRLNIAAALALNRSAHRRPGLNDDPLFVLPLTLLVVPARFFCGVQRHL
jgi:hypothetical protein